MDNMKTVYPPQTKFGGYNNWFQEMFKYSYIVIRGDWLYTQVAMFFYKQINFSQLCGRSLSVILNSDWQFQRRRFLEFPLPAKSFLTFV